MCSGCLFVRSNRQHCVFWLSAYLGEVTDSKVPAYLFMREKYQTVLCVVVCLIDLIMVYLATLVSSQACQAFKCERIPNNKLERMDKCATHAQFETRLEQMIG